MTHYLRLQRNTNKIYFKLWNRTRPKVSIDTSIYVQQIASYNGSRWKNYSIIKNQEILSLLKVYHDNKNPEQRAIYLYNLLHDKHQHYHWFCPRFKHLFNFKIINFCLAYKLQKLPRSKTANIIIILLLYYKYQVFVNCTDICGLCSIICIIFWWSPHVQIHIVQQA